MGVPLTFSQKNMGVTLTFFQKIGATPFFSNIAPPSPPIPQTLFVDFSQVFVDFALFLNGYGGGGWVRHRRKVIFSGKKMGVPLTFSQKKKWG